MYQISQKPEKISDNIIAQIRDSILSGKIKPGDKLASEKELIIQFGVSKASMREALRVLEAMGLIEIRKGISGGAFVAEVDMRTTVHSIMNFLHFQSVSIREVTMLRFFIEPRVAQFVALNHTEEDMARLKEIIGKGMASAESELPKGISFHRYLARMAGNPMLTLIIDFVDSILESKKKELHLGVEFYSQVRRDHEIVAECIEQRDLVASAVAIRNDIIEVGRYMCEVRGSEPFNPSELSTGERYTHLFELVDFWTGIAREGDEKLNQLGIIMRRVGKSNLFLFSQR